MRKGANLVGRFHRLDLAQVSGAELIEAGDAEEAHGGGDFAFQQFEDSCQSGSAGGGQTPALTFADGSPHPLIRVIIRVFTFDIHSSFDSTSGSRTAKVKARPRPSPGFLSL